MYFTSIFSVRFHSSGSKGFTLVELLVVISIMFVITSALLLRQQKFDSAIIMRTLAYNVALSVRQAQVYGTSVRETALFNVPLQAAYGVYFSASDNYQLFADINNDSAYEIGEEVQSFTLSSNYTINNFCAIVGSTQYCKSGGTGSADGLALLFKRPNPDALIVPFSGGSPVGGSFSSASIELAGPGGDTRTISVSSTGQITVCAANVSNC